MTIHVTHPDPFGEAVHLVLTPIRCLMWPDRSRRSLPNTDWRTENPCGCPVPPPAGLSCRSRFAPDTAVMIELPQQHDMRCLYLVTKCPCLIASLRGLAVFPIRTDRFPMERKRGCLQRVCLRDP